MVYARAILYICVSQHKDMYGELQSNTAYNKDKYITFVTRAFKNAKSYSKLVVTKHRAIFTSIT